MCGLFGFISKNGRGPDVARLKRIATVTQTRGAHAFGLAWQSAGPVRVFKRPGPATDDLSVLERCRHAVVVIGHCRYATHGAPEDNRNNHPHASGTGTFVHNGVVHNHDVLTRYYGLRLDTECDSEVIGRLMARSSGSLAHRAARAAEMIEGQLAVLGIWRHPTRLLIVRGGKPLFAGETDAGVYFGSLPEHLPGRVEAVPDGTARVWRHTRRRLCREKGCSFEPWLF